MYLVASGDFGRHAVRHSRTLGWSEGCIQGPLGTLIRLPLSNTEGSVVIGRALCGWSEFWKILFLSRPPRFKDAAKRGIKEQQTTTDRRAEGGCGE